MTERISERDSASRAPRPVTGLEPARATSRPPRTGASHQRGVLVVENDPDLQWGLARMLTVLGHRVVGTSSSDGALALLAEWPVDLALIAEDLPGMDGLELSRHLHARAPAMPIILLANDGPGVEAAAAAAGVAAYLVKPFRLETLRELVMSMQPTLGSPG